jgi:hypothetical protein
LEWKLESGWVGGGSGGGSSSPPIEWYWQCDKTVKYVGYINLSFLIYINYVFNAYISPDGVNFYVLGTPGSSYNSTDTYIYWFKLTTPWDITTAQFQSKFNLSGYLNQQFISTGLPVYGLYFSRDGRNLYTYPAPSGYIRNLIQLRLGEPWDIRTIYYSDKIVPINWNYRFGLIFKPDGTKMYISDTSIIEFSLATPWDITTITNLDGDARLFVDNYKIYAYYFKPDGSGVYVTGIDTSAYNRPAEIRYCDLLTPWSLDNYIYRGLCFDAYSVAYSAGVNLYKTITDLLFTGDGKFVYVRSQADPVFYIFTVVT